MKRPWWLGLVVLLLGGLALVGWLMQGENRSPGPDRVAAACAAGRTPLPRELGSDEAAIRAVMQAALDDWTAAHSDAAELQLGLIWGQGDWAAGEVAAFPAGPGSSEGTLVLARREGGRWRAFLPGGAEYTSVAEAGPAAFLPTDAADALRVQGTTQYSDTQGIYYLPHTAGTQDLVTCFDCYPGHAPAVDLYSFGDHTIRAARGGTVIGWQDVGDLCCCQYECYACDAYIALDHGDGEYSIYRHLASGSIPEAYRHLGVFVPRGAAIGVEGDVGHTCGSSRQETGCGPVTPVPGRTCGRHVHLEVRDAYPWGQRLRPRFQDVYEQTDPPTYFVEQGATYVSGNTPVNPTPTPTPTPTAAPLPPPPTRSCPTPAAPEGAFLYAEANYCGPYAHFTASDPDVADDLAGVVRSLHLAGPYTATLFTAPAYSGTAEVFLAGDPDLSDNPVATATASLSVSVVPCPVLSPGIVLYSAPGYGGVCRRFTADDPDLNGEGLAGAVRALRVVGPYSVTLFSQIAFSGTAQTFLSSTPDLTGQPISTTASSLRVGRPSCNPWAEGATLYGEAGYGGTCATVISSTADLSASAGLSGVASLRLRGPFRVTLFAEPGYSGTAEVLLDSDPDLGNNPISTTARSAIVSGMPCRPWGEGVTLYAGRGYAGACVTLVTSTADLSPTWLAGSVWSVQVRGPYRATLYTERDYGGTAEGFDRSDADLSDNAILSATASVRLEALPCPAGAGGVTLWAQPGYGGPCSTFRASDPDLADDAIGADNTFSLRVIGPYSVSLYPEAGYGGTPAVVLGDLPELRGSLIGTATASLRVEALSETVPLWNDLRAYPLVLAVSVSPTTYVQDAGPASLSPDDPLLSCAGLSGTRTLWYRPLLTEAAVLRVRAWAPGAPALALWWETGAGLVELGCVVGERDVLEALVPAGGRVLLEAVLLGEEGGGLSLVLERRPAWSFYLPLVLRGTEGAFLHGQP